MKQHIGITRAGNLATVAIERPPHNHGGATLVGGPADTLDGPDRTDDGGTIMLARAGRVLRGGAHLPGDTPPASDSGAPETPILYRNAVRPFATRKPIFAAVRDAAAGAADFRGGIRAVAARRAGHFARG